MEQPDGSLKNHEAQMCTNCNWTNMLTLIIQNGGLIFYEQENDGDTDDLAQDTNN